MRSVEFSFWWKLEEVLVLISHRNDSRERTCFFETNKMIDSQGQGRNFIGLSERVATISQLSELEAGQGRERETETQRKGEEVEGKCREVWIKFSSLDFLKASFTTMNDSVILFGRTVFKIHSTSFSCKWRWLDHTAIHTSLEPCPVPIHPSLIPPLDMKCPLLGVSPFNRSHKAEGYKICSYELGHHSLRHQQPTNVLQWQKKSTNIIIKNYFRRSCCPAVKMLLHVFHRSNECYWFLSLRLFTCLFWRLE